MNIKQFQTDVHEWTSGYEERYFPPLEILANMHEEQDEALDELNKNPVAVQNLSKELVDLLFATCCMANSHNYIGLELYTKTTPLVDDAVEYLRKSMMGVTRATLQKHGHKKPKKTDTILNLEEELSHVLKAIETIANKNNVDLDAAWETRFKERTSRDTKRFTKRK